MTLATTKPESSKSKNKRFSRQKLKENYRAVRNFSHKLASPLTTEDYVIQSMPDVSPTKWHLAHTSWFFEEFVLSDVYKNYESVNPKYRYLFNSYYVQVGERHCRPKRGLISRPTVEEIYEYREYVDEKMENLFGTLDENAFSGIASLIEIGIHHEQQHQELILTDIKHVFSENPLDPVYSESSSGVGHVNSELKWIEFEGGIYTIGNDGSRFGYDNEGPQHETLLQDFKLASRLVTNREYMEFINDGSYKKPELWLSDGWNVISSNNWKAPLYWDDTKGEWWHFTLNGFKKVNPDEPVSHLSFYEAEAFARWTGARLPSEFEWEVASQNLKVEGNFVENENYNPVANTTSENFLQQMYGDVWEWTQSPYTPYPGYKTLPGALGEYNGKFMCNQLVLRGGSCATSISHIRNTYRNFFPPDARWQFSGLRLARDES